MMRVPTIVRRIFSVKAAAKIQEMGPKYVKSKKENMEHYCFI
jgi:hypothetical protein